MVNQILAKIFGTKHEREMKRIQPVVDKINSFEPAISALTDEQLKAKTPEFKARIAKGETLDEILPEAFAVCREAAKRVLGMRHYDVQLIGGYVLHSGSISEMRTGEGKTLVATLPVYLNALSGKGVHVVTVNDYLAKRDASWMGRLYEWLGLSTGIIVHDLSDSERKAAYASDITYATNNELGFDYLRDNMKFDLGEKVQRELNFAIIDECDSILVDEARTPLIISGPAEASTDKYIIINKIIPHLKKEVHFTIEEKSKSAALTDEGNTQVEKLLNLDNLYDPQNIELLHHVYQALKAHHLYRRDVEYMVNGDEIVIVDEFTGRLMPGRRWSDGLHQAIEAKEGVKVKNENQTLATITFQNFFKMYNKMAGMTGTADTEAVEFEKIYNLQVTVIPTNRSIQRVDHEDVVYKTELAKFKAIVVDLRERFKKGQPALVGTVSIEKSELLSNFLRKEGIPHQVLNAKHHEREADIVAQAGRKGCITIATNMAGRGTDITLGGNAEALTKFELGADDGTPEYQAKFEALLEKNKALVEKEKAEVIAAGGLYIVGTERHESRRIDNQLRGRAGRQGDPGESKFYLSLEDDLMRIFNGERIQKIMTMMNVPEDEPIMARMVTNAIEGAQRKVEGHHFDVRKHLTDYDAVMNQQRTAIYGMRNNVMAGKEVERLVLDMLSDVTSAILDANIPELSKRESWNLEGLNNSMRQQFGIQIDFSNAQDLSVEKIQEAVMQSVKAVYERQKASIGQFFEQLCRMILLQAIDQRWKEHLSLIDRLKEGVNLRGYAQKDPLIEYKKEAFTAFEKLNASIKAEAIEKLMRVQLVAGQQQEALDNMMEELEGSTPDDLEFKGADEDSAGGGFSDLVSGGPSVGGGSLAGASSGAQAAPQQRQKMTMTAGPAQDSKPNRADRRKAQKRR